MGWMEDFGFFLSRTFATSRAERAEWPFVAGTYFVVDPQAPVAVTTLGSVALASLVAQNPPKGLCIVGKVETENIGIEKIIKNILSNPAIRFLICAGDEPPKHLTGGTLMALFRNGVDERNRIIGSPAMRPILSNTRAEEVQALRAQVEPVDMIGCTDIAAIHAMVAELAASVPERAVGTVVRPAGFDEYNEGERVVAAGVDPSLIKLDPDGYFVIAIDGRTLQVEHYSNKDKLLRVIVGQDARSIYLTIVRNGWVSKLDHACYLGKELTKAELSIRSGFEYVKDGG